jgi:signal transduction histidine kinase
MSADFLSWMAEEIGLPALHAAGGVVLRASDPARDLLGEVPEGADLIATAARLTGVTPEDPALLGLVARADATGSASGAVGDGRWRLLVHRSAPGHLQLVAAPEQLTRGGHLLRRAAAADVAAGVSHEVANALSAIVGWAQLGLQQGDERSAETFGHIEDSARAARSAARRLLDAVRTPSEQVSEQVDLHAMATDVTRLSRLQARHRGVHVDCHVQEGTFALGTSAALFTIVWNLVSNAIDALGEGGTVSITATAQDGTVRLVVADDGPGMDEAQRRRAFDAYYTTKASGTGLGLALVKQAVEDLGGRILLETARGQGTRFVVELPRADPATADLAGPGTERRRSGVHGRDTTQGLRVLIVEDDDALREMMRTALELRLACVDAVGSAAEALRCTGPYDVALVDLALSDARGDHLVAQLRDHAIIGASAIVTGASEPPDLNPAGKPDVWLRKPFDPADLIETVQLLSTFTAPSATATRSRSPTRS